MIGTGRTGNGDAVGSSSDSSELHDAELHDDVSDISTSDGGDSESELKEHST